MLTKTSLLTFIFAVLLPTVLWAGIDFSKTGELHRGELARVVYVLERDVEDNSLIPYTQVFLVDGTKVTYTGVWEITREIMEAEYKVVLWMNAAGQIEVRPLVETLGERLGEPETQETQESQGEAVQAGLGGYGNQELQGKKYRLQVMGLWSTAAVPKEEE